MLCMDTSSVKFNLYIVYITQYLSLCLVSYCKKFVLMYLFSHCKICANMCMSLVVFRCTLRSASGFLPVISSLLSCACLVQCSFTHSGTNHPVWVWIHLDCLQQGFSTMLRACTREIDAPCLTWGHQVCPRSSLGAVVECRC